MSVVTNKTFHEELDKLKQVLEIDPTIVVDVETNGLDSFGYNQICGIGLGETNHEGLSQYYPIRHHVRLLLFVPFLISLLPKIDYI
mgnify:CR=1 FL=1